METVWELTPEVTSFRFVWLTWVIDPQNEDDNSSSGFGDEDLIDGWVASNIKARLAVGRSCMLSILADPKLL